MTSAVTPDPIDCAALGALAVNDSSGAIVTFTGAVRNHDHGREVVGIEYVGHPSASQVLDEVVESFSERAGVQAVVAQHRTGLCPLKPSRNSLPLPGPMVEELVVEEIAISPAAKITSQCE